MDARATILAACGWLVAAQASAGGFEAPSAGTRALGRAGAFAVRADDGMALAYDPAALALLPQPTMMFNLHLVFYDACMQRSGMYGDDVSMRRYDVSRFGEFGTYAAEPFAEVCREGAPGLSPSIVYTLPIGERLGIGIGIVSPVGSGTNRWGGEDGSVRGVTGADRPTPTRYALVEAQAIKISLDMGIGWQVTPGLSLGLNLRWGIAYSDHVRTYSHPLTSSDGPSFDAASEVRGVTDFFLPGVVASVHAEPVRGLELMGGASWWDDFEATGTAVITWGDFGVGPTGARTGLRGTERRVSEIDEMTLRVPQQTKLFGGMRFASLRDRARARPRGSRRDPLVDEHFDVELDAVVELNERVDAVVATPGEGSTFTTAIVDPTGVVIETPLAVPVSRVEKHWRNQITLHLGGDVVLAPGRFALRGGISYESRGADPRYLSVDFMPLQRIGLHLGATLRIGEIDLDLAYAHHFQETVTVTEAQARFEQLGDGVGEYVNAGTYRASWNLVSAGVTWRL